MKTRRLRIPNEFYLAKLETVNEIGGMQDADSFDLNLLRVLFACYIEFRYCWFSILLISKILTGNKYNHLLKNSKKDTTLTFELIKKRIDKLMKIKIENNGILASLIRIQVIDEKIRFVNEPLYIRECLNNAKIIEFECLKLENFHQSMAIINLKFFIIDSCLKEEGEITILMKSIYRISGFEKARKKARADYMNRRITYTILKKRESELRNTMMKMVDQILTHLVNYQHIDSYLIDCKKILIDK